MSWINLTRSRWLWTIILLVGVVGCWRSEPVDERLAARDPTKLVPVSGVVTFNGKPRGTVIVTFLPPSGPGLAVGETDENGKYVLESMGGPGALPGEYRVGISYMVSEKGEPLGKSAHSGLMQTPALLKAKELMPREYDLGRTKLSAKVGPKGGEFNFALPVDLPEVAPKPAEKKAAEGKTPEERPAEKKTSEGKSPEKKTTELKKE